MGLIDYKVKTLNPPEIHQSVFTQTHNLWTIKNQAYTAIANSERWSE